MPKIDDEDRQRHEGQQLDRGHVGQVAAQTGEELGHLAEHDPAVHVQQVAGGQDHDHRGDGGGQRADGERADEAQELADEARTGRAARPTRRRRSPNVAA